jgi:hypothetical protein
LPLACCGLCTGAGEGAWAKIMFCGDCTASMPEYCVAEYCVGEKVGWMRDGSVVEALVSQALAPQQLRGNSERER